MSLGRKQTTPALDQHWLKKRRRRSVISDPEVILQGFIPSGRPHRNSREGRVHSGHHTICGGHTGGVPSIRRARRIGRIPSDGIHRSRRIRGRGSGVALRRLVAAVAAELQLLGAAWDRGVAAFGPRRLSGPGFLANDASADPAQGQGSQERWSQKILKFPIHEGLLFI